MIIKNLKDINLFHSHNYKSVGFVPTMGNLHLGHLSLIKESLKENQVTVISIFVNPKQFGEVKDLEEYPRTLEADMNKANALLNEYPGKEIFYFIPENEEVIYPSDFSDYVSIEHLCSISEGETRPGHFDGVATVVHRLFNLIKPQNAYFGIKDYQQFLVVKALVKLKNHPVKIIGMPIVREEDGLAMSSRNIHLDKAQRIESLDLSQTLLNILLILQTQGLEIARGFIKEKLKDTRFNYLEIRNSDSFELAIIEDTNFVILGNLQLGTVRLLDNVEVMI
jgi:pantoate--beta-alanine ligase